MTESIFEWDEFLSLSRTEQALVIIWEREFQTGSSSVSVAEINQRFVEVGLPKQNQTRLVNLLRSNSGSRKLGVDKFGITTKKRKEIEKLFSEALTEHHKTPVSKLERPPFIKDALYDALPEMAELYGHLFLLENSLRGLIENRLRKLLGDDWWNIASNTGMKKKHEERLKKESDNRWAPARNELGPLYALDWTDLITLVRKYEGEFLDIIGSISFMHRFEDLGALRNVVAHNGVISDEAHFVRIKLAFDDWLRQSKPR